MKNKIFILYGGPTSERDVSFSTKDFFLNLYKEYNPILLEWNTDFSFTLEDTKYSQNEILDKLKKEAKVVIIASHGEYVEDGYLQEILSINSIPFTGSSSASCTLSINKYESQLAVANIINVIPTYKTKPSKFKYQMLIDYIGEKYPIIAKPNFLGSSIGVAKYKTKEELLKDIKNLRDIEYLFQPAIDGVDVTLSTVKEGTKYMDLTPTKITHDTDFYNYSAKYINGNSKHQLPAKLDEQVINKIKKITPKIHETLGLGYYSRTDYLVTKQNKIYYLETNSLPGMTTTSLLPEQILFANRMQQFKQGLISNAIKNVTIQKKLIDVPYFSQFTNENNNNLWNDNKEISLDGYEISGAKNTYDFLKESKNACGSACIQMILSYFDKKVKKIFDIFYKLKEMGFYGKVGLIYEDIDKFFKKYKLKARTYRINLTIDEIISNTQENKLTVVSVDNGKDTHLILIVGYDTNESKLIFHDPSGYTGKNKFYEISFDELKKIYFKKGFCVYK